jgi:SPP1 family predicted phage head-tail adaptor
MPTGPTDIGKLRHRVTIQTLTTARSGHTMGETWADTATVWGSVDPLSGREIEYAQRVDARATFKITIRYYSGLTPENRFTFDSRNFNILAVQNSGEQNIIMTCLCEKVGT